MKAEQDEREKKAATKVSCLVTWARTIINALSFAASIASGLVERNDGA